MCEDESEGMCENRTPFLSLDKAAKAGPGEVCDLGTVLARHSMLAWIDYYEGDRAVVVALEVSHDGIHWHELGHVGVAKNYDNSWPTTEYDTAWPARYVRARITDWPKGVTGGLVSAMVASA